MIKEKFFKSLGTFGSILDYFIRIVIAVLPFVMISGNFFVTFILIMINSLVPFANVIFWVWGLVCALKGIQDIWAILYYIIFLVVWVPFFVLTIISALKK